jgi:hypothetical protein
MYAYVASDYNYMGRRQKNVLELPAGGSKSNKSFPPSCCWTNTNRNSAALLGAGLSRGRSRMDGRTNDQTMAAGASVT